MNLCLSPVPLCVGGEIHTVSFYTDHRCILVDRLLLPIYKVINTVVKLIFNQTSFLKSRLFGGLGD
jgi:hypothetical protein